MLNETVIIHVNEGRVYRETDSQIVLCIGLLNWLKFRSFHRLFNIIYAVILTYL